MHDLIELTLGHCKKVLDILSMRMAVEAEALDTLYPDTDTTSSASSESAAEIVTATRFADLEARMLSMERVVMRLVAVASEACDEFEIPGRETPEPSD